MQVVYAGQWARMRWIGPYSPPVLIQQGSEDVGASVAQFCREAAIARAVLWEARRGFNWTDPEVWGQIIKEQIERVEAHDAKLSRHVGPSLGDSTPTLPPEPP